MAKRPLLTQSDVLRKKFPEDKDLPSYDAIISMFEKHLAEAGFVINESLYRTNIDMSITQGVMFLDQGESMVSPVVGWVHSYNDMFPTKFVVGASVDKNVIIKDAVFKKPRKNDTTLEDVIKNVVASIKPEVSKINTQMETLYSMGPIGKEKLFATIAEMFLINEVITTEQLSGMKAYIKQNDIDTITPWDFYVKMFCSVMWESHPSKWIKQQTVGHEIMCKKFDLPTTFDVPEEVLESQEDKDQLQDNDFNVVMEMESEPNLDDQNNITTDVSESSDNTGSDYDIDVSPFVPIQGSQSEDIFNFTTVEEDTFDDAEADFMWQCLKCGEMQGMHDIFHDGQLCSKCVEHI